MVLADKKSCQRYASQRLLLILIIVSTVFFCFWSGKENIYRRDDFALEKERTVFVGDSFDFFLHFISISRTRIHASGDTFLFRPGTHLSIYVQHFLVKNKLVVGLSSIFIASVISILIFIILQSVLGLPAFISAYATLLFILDPLSMDIILWRQISPYMCAVLFFCLGVVYCEFSKKKSIWVFSFMLFLSTLFHEYVAITVLFMVVYLVALRFFLNFKNDHSSSFKNFFPTKLIFSILLGVFFIWAGLNIFEYFHYGHTIKSFVSDNGSDKWGLLNSRLDFIINSVKNIFVYAGATLEAAFAPLAVTVSPSNSLSFSWKFSNQPFMLKILFSTLSMLFFVINLIAVTIDILRERQLSLKNFMLLYCMLSLLVCIIFLVLGRGMLRGIDYIEDATYYYFFTSFSWYILAAYSLQEFSRYIKKNFNQLRGFEILSIFNPRYGLCVYLGIYIQTLRLMVNSMYK
ncbi:hypothetical protein [Solidesulfovibrio magneticus]|nr:hypothetical protein [Solidesulfovibrio magneticus]